MSKLCKCGNQCRSGQKNCQECHSAYMRAWRKTHPMSEEQKKKDNCRSYAGTYLRRGKLKKSPCIVCGENAEMHHDNYDKPLEITWLCRKHHLEHHKHIKDNDKHGTFG